jgi:hypothetical protein
MSHNGWTNYEIILAMLAVLLTGCDSGLPTESGAPQGAPTPVPSRGPSPTPTPVYWSGAIRCSYLGGPPEPCPACPNGETSCALPPGWTAVCLDAHGVVIPCPAGLAWR